MIESPAITEMITKMLPKILPSLYSADFAPRFTAHLSLDSPGFSSEDLYSSFVYEKKEGPSELVREIQKQIDELERNNDDNDKTEGRPKNRNSICDILRQLGFWDVSKNEELVDKYNGDIEKILDELIL